MVALLSSGSDDNFQAQFCGGSIVDSAWVLTAAHCVVSEGETAPADSIDVLIGSIDLNADDGDRVALDAIVVHPDYDELSMQNDLALLHLVAPTDADPIAWADASSLASEVTGTIVTLTGWGGLTVDQDDQTFPSMLQEADMPVLANAVCLDEVGGFDIATMVCAGDPETDADGGIDACQGDSGGPLVATEPGGAKVQIGIVSFGPTCGLTPTAYTRVSTYAGFIDATIGSTESGGDEGVDRVSGANRFATAAALATARFEPGVTVFVVTGRAFPDALAAAAAASVFGGPILLTEKTSVPAETLDALDALAPEEIFVVGGTGAVSDAVVATLDAFAPVSRIAGDTRYETAAELADRAFGTAEGSAVFLASGVTFADALSGAAAAAAAPATPLLLTARDALPAETEAALVSLNPDAVFVLGGEAAVSAAVEDSIAALGFTVVRLAGDDRYETSAAIVDASFGASDEVLVATGTNFPDGLVAGALGLPLLLVPSSGIPQATAEAFTARDPISATILGGANAVSESQSHRLADLLAS